MPPNAFDYKKGKAKKINNQQELGGRLSQSSRILLKMFNDPKNETAQTRKRKNKRP